MNLKQSIQVLAGMVLIFALQLFAFTEPTLGPPAGNVPAPLHVGVEGQSKSGGLVVNTGGAPTGLIVSSGAVGFGTSSPRSALEIVGNIILGGATPTYTIKNLLSPVHDADAATKAFVMAAGGGGGGNSKSQLFTANGTFSVPSGVSLVYVTLLGGGGGGTGGRDVPVGWSGSPGSAGGGGGGGELKYRIPVTVTPLSQIPVTVGQGGTGSLAGSSPDMSITVLAGANGGTSSFGSYASAQGGSGAPSYSAGPGGLGLGGNGGGSMGIGGAGVAGNGGNGSGSTLVFGGGAGSSGSYTGLQGNVRGGHSILASGGLSGSSEDNSTRGGGGGGAGAWYTGNGANGGNGGISGPGQNGASAASGSNGGGGGGGAGQGPVGTPGGNGGNGGSGYAIIEWVEGGGGAGSGGSGTPFYTTVPSKVLPLPPSSTSGVLITSGADPTDGLWYEMMSAPSNTSDKAIVEMRAGVLAQEWGTCRVDIGTGASGSEIVGGTFFASSHVDAYRTEVTELRPALFIPQGSRISMRAMCFNGNKSLRTFLRYYDLPLP